jgi:hypothetical protein
MSQADEHSAASGLLTELDDIRSLLDDSLPEDAIPVLEDAVSDIEPIREPAAFRTGDAADELEPPLDPADLEGIPLLDDAIPDGDEVLEEWADAEPFEDEPEYATVEPAAIVVAEAPAAAAVTPREAPAPFPPGASVAELLAAQELQTAVRNRVDAIFERWLTDTLQQELNLLRARLLEAVRAEVHEYVTTQIQRSNVTGSPHGE